MVERNKRNRDFAETRTPVGVIGGLIGLVAASTAVAALVVAAATPAIAMVGLAASGTIGMFDNLPGYLEIDELSEKSNIYAIGKDKKPVLLASFYDQNRVEVGWSAIDQDVKDATIASEDPRFYDHGGVDIQGTLRAAVTTASGRETQGGSSIAQQYVKNVRVQECELSLDEAVQDDCYDAVTETTIDRKIKEMRLAIGIEKRYSKDEILLGYLNIAGFGGTVYGIEAAANYYFSASASNLTLAQAASLVAIVNNPVKFQLDKPNNEANGAANGYAQNLGRRNYILGRMLALGKITRVQYDEAVATPVEPKITEPSTGCHTAGASAYFCDYVKNILQTDPIFGEDAETRMLNFRRGGYDVYTSLDLELQAAADQAMRENVPMTYPGWDVGGVISSVQVGTGRVLAMVQNKLYSQDPLVLQKGPQYTSINYNTDYSKGGSSGFQPGSTYKVFTLAQWLNEGHSLNERVDSAPKSNWGVFHDSCLGDWNTNPEGWNPRNDANESGGSYSALESTIALDQHRVRRHGEGARPLRHPEDRGGVRDAPCERQPARAESVDRDRHQRDRTAEPRRRVRRHRQQRRHVQPDRHRPHRRPRRQGRHAAEVHVREVGVTRDRRQHALCDAPRHDERHRPAVEPEHRAAGAAHRQDRNDRRCEGHVDGRCEHQGRDGGRGRQRHRRPEPARHVLRQRAGGDRPAPHVAGRDVGRCGEVRRWRVHRGCAGAGRVVR